MATAFETFTGTDGASWSPLWVVGQSTGASSADLNSNRGRMTLSQAGSYTDRRTQRLSAAGTWGDVVLSGTVEFPTLASENFGQVWVRAGTDIATDGYFLSLSPFYGDVGLFKRVGGTQTQLGSSVAFGWAANTVTSWKVEAVGTTIRAKVWTGSEPGPWTITQTDTSHTSGWIGLSLDGGASTSQTYRCFWDGVEFPGPARVPVVSDTAPAAARARRRGGSRQTIVVRPRAGGPVTYDVSIASVFGVNAAAQRAAFAGVQVAGTFGLTADADVVSPPDRTFRATVEVELTPGRWTDMTERLCFRSPVRIRHGRPTEWDDVGPSSMALALWNDDGALVPDNVGSPLHPDFREGKRIRFRLYHYDPTRPSSIPTAVRVQRTERRLFLATGHPWRAAGVNMYWLALNENVVDGSGYPTYPSHATVDSAMQMARGMGANIVRCHTLAASVGKPKTIYPSLGAFDATALDQADYVIASAKQRGLYVAFPLVDRWDYYHGGVLQWAGFRGLSTASDFYTNATVIADFKAFITSLLNHVNPYTGTAWKDEPAIAYVATGNELYDAPTAWTTDIAAHVKSVAPNLLVMDGSGGSGRHTTDSALSDSNIDIVTTHFYGAHRMDIDWLIADADTAFEAGKAFLVSEYDWTDGPNNGSPAPSTSTTREEWLRALESVDNVAGAMMWGAFLSGAADVGTHRDGYELYQPTAENSEQAAGAADLRAHFARMSQYPYTRFVGPMQAIEPDFPDDSTNGAMVSVVATNVLGLLAQRRMRSTPVENALWRARVDGGSVTADAFEWVTDTASSTPYPVQYNAAGVLTPRGVVTSGDWPNLEPSPPDAEITAAGIATGRTDANGNCNRVFFDAQGDIRFLQFAFKTPTERLSTSGSFRPLLTLETNTGTRVFNLSVDLNGASNGLLFMNATNTASLAVLCNLPFGQWIVVNVSMNSSNNAQTDVAVYQKTTYLGGWTGAVDMRTARRIVVPGSSSPSFSGAWASFVAFSGSKPSAALNVSDFYRTGLVGASSIPNTTSDLPITWTFFGGAGVDLAAGHIAGRYALDCMQEVMRTGQGILWARPWDSVACRVWPSSGLLRSLVPVATVDTDADCLGPPRLERSVNVSPTRVEVTWPGGRAVAVDTAAESAAGGASRARSFTSVSASASAADTLARALLAQGVAGTRVKDVTVDLLRGRTDHTQALLSEAGSLGGLYPLQRIRTAVPVSHFGVPTRDHYVQGWTEEYGPDTALVRLDTTPAIPQTFHAETWTGSDGASWPVAWVNGQPGTGAYVAITGNEGQMWVGLTASVVSRRLSTFTAADVDITGQMRVFGTGDAAVYWRASSDLDATGLFVSFSPVNGARFGRLAGGGARTIVDTVTGPAIAAGTNYRFRIRHQGPYLTVKYWAATDPAEATEWGLDTSEDTVWQGGYAGVGVYGTNQTAYFDSFTVTSGG